MMRLFAWLYAAVILVLGSYAWVADLALRNSVREHLLPDILLAMATMPLSLSLERFASLAPRALGSPFGGLTLLTLFGVAQAGLLFWLTRPSAKAPRATPNNRGRGP